MSFVRALAGVAVGFATAKGIDKYREIGGMAGLQDALQGMGDSQTAVQLGQLADQFGLPGGSAGIKTLFGQMGMATASASAAGAAGLGSLMAGMRSATEAGTRQSAEMMEAMFSNTPVGDAMEQQAKLMIRTMIQAAKADGEIDAEEQAAILDSLGAEITDEEREFVKSELQSAPDVTGLIKDASDVGREQVYSTALAAIRLDNAAETQFLQQLAAGLGLNREQLDAIHDRMGVPPLSE